MLYITCAHPSGLENADRMKVGPLQGSDRRMFCGADIGKCQYTVVVKGPVSVAETLLMETRDLSHGHHPAIPVCRDLCFAEFSGVGSCLSLEQLMMCATIALQKAAELSIILHRELWIVNSTESTRLQEASSISLGSTQRHIG